MAHKKTHRIIPDPHIMSLRSRRNKNFPNSSLPVVIYKSVLALPAQKKKAVETVQKIFHRNQWSNAWQNGIYDFHHYHSNTHECMAIVKGKADVILGGPKGKKTTLESGDVIILPAGTGHKCLTASEDFLCVGAYPQGKDYDINYGKASEFEKAKKTISDVPQPKKDPVFGKEGFLKSLWKK